VPRRVAVWTPHALRRLDIESAARDAARLLNQLQQVAVNEVLRDGLIMTPARGSAETAESVSGKARVKAIALGPAGADLAQGFEAVREFVRGEIYGVSG
jgi:hypothetical protein